MTNEIIKVQPTFAAKVDIKNLITIYGKKIDSIVNEINSFILDNQIMKGTTKTSLKNRLFLTRMEVTKSVLPEDKKTSFLGYITEAEEALVNL